jgi:hypothetical protein
MPALAISRAHTCFWRWQKHRSTTSLVELQAEIRAEGAARFSWVMLSYRPVEPIECPTLVLGEAGHCDVIFAYASATVGGRALDRFAFGRSNRG